MSLVSNDTHRRVLTAAALGLTLLCAGTQAGAASATPGAEPVDVSFGEGCRSATVSSNGPVAALVTVYSDQRRERIAELPRAASYLVRVAPQAVASGLTITTLFVHTGEPEPFGTQNAQYGEAGERFECDAGGAPKNHLARKHRNS